MIGRVLSILPAGTVGDIINSSTDRDVGAATISAIVVGKLGKSHKYSPQFNNCNGSRYLLFLVKLNRLLYNTHYLRVDKVCQPEGHG
jgi:hypothetical protein